MKSSVMTGNELRDAVFALLIAARKENCVIEKSLNGKNVDVYFEQPRSVFGVDRIAVECKNYSKSLDRDDITKILSHYTVVKPAFDYLLIVSNAHPTPGVLETIEATGWAKHFTFVQFSNWLMDFSNYMRSLEAQFANEGLDEYYVPIKDAAGADVAHDIDEWISSQSYTPRAILASYGMGKTSFAKKMAFDYAVRSRQGVPCRIPIYLKLGDIYNEQGLEGLICKYFSSRYSVKGFSYPLFLELNKYGRLVIILDGFDEMKHAMSFHSFKAMIAEFNQLIVPSSKVIILGRPNIFTSESEKLSVLHGVRRIGERELKSAELADYHEVEIRVFDKHQLESFVDRFLIFMRNQARQPGKEYLTDAFLESRKREILDERYSDLISKPVHARMLCVLAVSTDEKLSSFNRFELYKEFLDLFLERELGKAARRQIDAVTRKNFIQRLAWSLWKKRGNTGFSYSEIQAGAGSIDVDAPYYQDVLRELVLGSVLDNKGGDYYYFSHRSFQEYLVSEQLLSLTSWTHEELSSLSRTINDEIVSFVNESGCSEVLAESLWNALDTYRGDLTWNLLRFFEGKVNFDENPVLQIALESSPWKAFVLVYNANILDVKKHPLLSLGNLPEDQGDISAFAALLALVLNLKDAVQVYDWVGFIVGTVIGRSLSVIENVQINKNKIVRGVGVIKGAQRNWVKVLLSSIKPVISNNNEVTDLVLDIKELSKNLGDILREHIQLPDFDEMVVEDEISVNIDYIDSYVRPHVYANGIGDFDFAAKESKRKIRNFWRCQPLLSQFVSIEVKDSMKERRKKLTLRKSNK